jgi:hypothetical protein
LGLWASLRRIDPNSFPLQAPSPNGPGASSILQYQFVMAQLAESLYPIELDP